MPQRQPKRRRLWLGDGSIVRRRAEHRDHVWSYDFVFDRTAYGRPLRLLPIVDEYTRECLSIDVGRRLNSEHVLARLAELFVRRGVPAYIRSDNGPEFTRRGAYLDSVSVCRTRMPIRNGVTSPLSTSKR